MALAKHVNMNELYGILFI